MTQRIESLAGDFGDFPDIQKKLLQVAEEAREAGVPEKLESKTRASQQIALAEALPSRLEPIRFVLEIPTISEELYDRTREAVEQAGYNFIVSVRSVSMQDLLAEDELREQRGEPRRLGYVNGSERMLATVPPEMEVAINPAKFKIEGSNRLPTDEQKRRIKQEQAKLRGQVPENLQPFINMKMVDPSTLSQLEDRYMEENNGALLLLDWFARTDVQTVPGLVADVGRYGPGVRRLVLDWRRAGGRDGVFAASVVVLPRKLTA